MAISFFSCYAIEMMKQGRFKTEEEAFRFMHDSGVEYADIFDADLAEYPLYLYREFMEAGGVKPACLISTLNVVDLDSKVRAKGIYETKQRIDLCAKCGVPTLMVAPFGFVVKSEDEFKKTREIMIETFSELVNYGKKSGITISAENHSNVWRPDSRMKDVRYLIDCVPELIYILDTGNFFCIGEDIRDAYELLKDRTEHVHCKDWKWDEYGDFERINLPRFRGCELGVGDVPLREVLTSLKKDGYNGKLVIELNSPYTWDELDNSIKFLRSEF